ncbi:MAG TPA: prenyltransferase/squalene oxidase repeat-containing protein [Urbifossiella sp.]|nr:prenyltransferase/squalene oxidase repeat-containing protein [Urbifossiella sp.]
MTPDRLRAAYRAARDALLAERVPAGHWVGELSTSALSTATAVMALHLVDADAHRQLTAGGIRWLAGRQNADGGWGDTTKSVSNISTTMLCRAALALTAAETDHPDTLRRVEAYLTAHAGTTPAGRAEAIRRRYGTDRTFSVPILMACALAGLVPWAEVPRLPFELACLPQSWYRFARLPVVSYALPALIAIGQCVHANRRSRNPVRNAARRLARGPSLKVLRRIQPTGGGYLEAAPLTSFVTMALVGAGVSGTSERAREVVGEGVRFLVASVRPDGSWPIDTNLATWVTTLSVNALAAAGDLESLDTRDAILDWLLKQQYRERHPYTGADPGGWAWTDLPGGVPDCDDTPGAMLAVRHLAGPAAPAEAEALLRRVYGPADLVDLFEGGGRWPRVWDHAEAGKPLFHVLRAVRWVWNLRNRDGGFPTFCRGWGLLPFDRSGTDLTAHALRALQVWTHPSVVAGVVEIFGKHLGHPPPVQASRGFIERAATSLAYLAREQRPDGSWLPLWFGNQYAPDDINPVYGTSRVLAAYRDLGRRDAPECQRGVRYLLGVQNADGGWGGAAGCPSSVEETGLAVEVLVELAPGDAVNRGTAWLVGAVESGRFRESSPIGFYFAKLWYFEKLYPLIFTVAALGRAVRGGPPDSASVPAPG